MLDDKRRTKRILWIRENKKKKNPFRPLQTTFQFSSHISIAEFHQINRVTSVSLLDINSSSFLTLRSAHQAGVMAQRHYKAAKTIEGFIWPPWKPQAQCHLFLLCNIHISMKPPLIHSTIHWWNGGFVKMFWCSIWCVVQKLSGCLHTKMLYKCVICLLVHFRQDCVM